MSLILFDLDGTLIDSREDLADAVNEVRSLHQLAPLPVPQVISYLGDGQKKLMARSLPELAGEEAQAAACREMTECYSHRLTNKTTLLPGVAQTLPRLARHHKLAVVSNKPDAASNTILQKLGVAQYFAVILGGGRCKALKPDPEPLRMAASLAGCTMEGAWVVGDHRTDLGAARACGIKACFCAFGFGIMDTQKADAVIQDFTLLTQIFND